MPSSTSASDRLPLVVGVVLALAAPLLASRLLPPAAPGTTLPAPPPRPHDLVDPATELVVIGNSKAGTDILVDQLRRELGAPELRVAVVVIGSATMPIHYLVVKNCVLGNGARPRAIVVYATPVELLTSDLLPDHRARLMRTHMVADEPVIARKLYRNVSGGWQGLRERAIDARDHTLNTVSAAVAGVVGGGEGRAELDAAFDRVFGSAWARRGGGVGTGLVGGKPSTSIMAQRIEDSFVVETWAEAKAAGVPLYYAVAPLSGEVRALEESRMRGSEALLAAALRQSDGWFRLPQPDDPALWGDAEHLNLVGAAANTQAFAAGLERVGW